ncbi:putative inorganic carbon transporter subunit DabA, partial [Dyadobacter sp.]|uniref:putative inorganic carbon transporter subunit DabA n=1 Tax=Dyadobacter sp. TaxID=1914288 RepID=UPI003F6E8D13
TSNQQETMQMPTTGIMDATSSSFDERETLDELKRLLPIRLPSKEFIHENPLKGFRTSKFHAGVRQAAEILDYKISLSPEAFRALYNARKVTPDILEKVLLEQAGDDHTSEWRERVLFKKYTGNTTPRIGALRAVWKNTCRIDLNAKVHPTLFRILSAYLEQGGAFWKFPLHENGFLASLRKMEQNSLASIFKTSHARNLLIYTQCDIPYLLDTIVGDESLFKHYLFDQQFAHPGWSGLVSTAEDQPGNLPDGRKISLHDLVAFELLLEIDAIDRQFGAEWAPLAARLAQPLPDLFAEVPTTELSRVLTIWQEAFEWSYYNQVLAPIREQKEVRVVPPDQHKHLPARICLIGSSSLFENINQDGHIMLHSYDHTADHDGTSLLNILKVNIPLYGESSLADFFSKSDKKQNGFKRILHQINKFLGFADHSSGDLRSGLPRELTENREPMRVLFIVEQEPHTILDTIKKLDSIYQWFVNEWVHLVAADPLSKQLYLFKEGTFEPYT